MSVPRAAGWLGRGAAVFVVTDQKPGRGVPEAKTRKVIFDAGRGWGQEEKGMIEDEMAGWHH